MKINNEFIVISVESRKGGVGKTSVAMNLARLLAYKEKYEIIFLDFDMSGTEASKFVPVLEKQNVWQGLIHVVKKPKSQPKTLELNIVDLFESYMTGENIPNVTWDNKINLEEEKDLFLQSRKINIFSSFIRRKNQYFNEPGHLYGPAALFDEIHSAWFISMIKELIVKCSREIPLEKKLVVIIDNAPGYSGLEPAVEDWLTDLGPQRGKFLLVSSIDTQDLLACLNAVNDIGKIFNIKWEASRKFLSMAREENTDILDLIHQSFFYKLAETNSSCDGKQYNSRKCVDCGFCYYRSASTDIGEKYKKNPQLSLAILLNKVPEIEPNNKIKIGDLLDTVDINADENLTLDMLEDFFSKSKEENFPQIMKVLVSLNSQKISYNYGLSLQFCIDRLVTYDDQPGKPMTSLEESHKKDIINTLSQVRLPEILPFAFPVNTVIQAKMNLIFVFGISLVNAIEELSKVVDIQVKAFWNDAFLLESQLFQVLRTFSKSEFKDSDEAISYYTYQISMSVSEFQEKIGLNSQLIQLASNNLKYDNDFSPIVDETLIKNIVQDIVIDIAIACYPNSLIETHNENLFNIEEDRYGLIVILLDLLFDKEVLDTPHVLESKMFWVNRLNIPSTRMKDLYAFVMNYYKLPNDKRFGLEQVSNLNKKICQQKIHFFDANDDFSFLIECINIISELDKSSSSDIGIISDIAKSVVHDKNITHGEGKKFLLDFQQRNKIQERLKIRDNVMELAEYNKVLNSILGNSQWDLL
jgi:hypothetical protein